MFTSSDVSVVIPSYNSSSTIVACLTSIQNQQDSPREIIVVDSSTDGTSQIIEHCFPSVKIRQLKERVFPGPARNRGARMARGEILAFIDSDCVAEPDWIRRVVAGHNGGHLAVGGAIMVGNPASSVAWAGHLGEFREFLPAGKPRPILHIPTCNVSYRRALFEAHGGFPDAYYPQEDLLFNYLLNQRGVEVWFDPDLRIRHFCRENLRDYLSHQHRIGRVTRCTLRRIKMPGSNIARQRWLAWLAAPALGVLKFLKTTLIFSTSYPEEIFRRPSLYGLLLLGAIWWSRGFAAGAQRGLSGIRGWDDPDETIFTMLVVASEAPKHK